LSNLCQFRSLHTIAPKRRSDRRGASAVPIPTARFYRDFLLPGLSLAEHDPKSDEDAGGKRDEAEPARLSFGLRKEVCSPDIN
jgi:hypothetical protein